MSLPSSTRYASQGVLTQEEFDAEKAELLVASHVANVTNAVQPGEVSTPSEDSRPHMHSGESSRVHLRLSQPCRCLLLIRHHARKARLQTWPSRETTVHKFCFW